MGYVERYDEPGMWHHVMNRGIARRPVFETRRDARFFLSRIALAVRGRQLEVHAYAILATHFHILVRCPTGNLSLTIGRVLNEYVRYYNRGRKRDGSLFRGRFRSRPARTVEYRRKLVQYIDDNPVQAGIAEVPELFEHGSARHYARRRGPIWLCREWVESEVRDHGKAADYDPDSYAACFARQFTDEQRRAFERRLWSRRKALHWNEDLVRDNPRSVVDRLEYKARLADRSPASTPIATASEIVRAIDRVRKEVAASGREPERLSGTAWRQLTIGLLRDLCGLTFSACAATVSMSLSGCYKAYKRHQTALLEDDGYRRTVERLVT